MSDQKFGPRRCRDTRKPPAGQCPEVSFYRCSLCGCLFPVTGGTCQEEKEILCCGKQAEHLIAHNPDTVKKQMTISYEITGGYNDNAVKVFWKTEPKTPAPEWLYLKTFTGGYLKYVAKTKRPPLVFALADTDAFAYCDEDPCLECVFRCKRGFVIYIYGKETGLLEIPLDKMTAHWESETNESES